MWHGWFIEQSRDDQSIFSELKTVAMQPAESWKIHVVEIPDDKVEWTVEFLKKHLKPTG